MNDLKKRLFVVFCCVFSLGVASIVAASDDGASDDPSSSRSAVRQVRKTYRLKATWTPQTQFAGFYIARRDGLYKAAGVDVEIIHSEPGDDVFDSLAQNRADFIVGTVAGALERRIQGADLVNVGQLAQASGEMLIARKSSGVVRFQDLSGKRVGIWPASSLRAAFLLAFQKEGCENVRVLPTLTNVDLFLYGAVDATAAMRYNEYYQILSSGIDEDELVCFYLNDFFPNWPADGLYCKSATYSESQDDCDAIRDATLEGWRRAFADKEATLRETERVCRENNVPFNWARQRWGLDEMEKMIFPPDRGNVDGVLSEEAFRDCLSAFGSDESQLSYRDFAPGSARQSKRGGAAKPNAAFESTSEQAAEKENRR